MTHNLLRVACCSGRSKSMLADPSEAPAQLHCEPWPAPIVACKQAVNVGWQQVALTNLNQVLWLLQSALTAPRPQLARRHAASAATASQTALSGSCTCIAVRMSRASKTTDMRSCRQSSGCEVYLGTKRWCWGWLATVQLLRC